MVLLEAAIRNLRGASVIDGDTVFKLYDTYGFPVDLTADVARERGLAIDQARFEAAMEEQRRLSREASKFAVDLRGGGPLEAHTLFRGYEGLSGPGRVVTLLKQGAQVEALEQGETGEVILDRTPFYAEAGGQVGDAGQLTSSGVRFIVSDTLKRGAAHAHIGTLAEGRIRVGDELEAEVDGARRQATALNHTATHLLHAALRNVLGTHVLQKGSLVAPDRLRFDFAHFQALTAEELTGIERLVNAQIRANLPAETRLMDYESAVAAGAMALFGEKYDKDVRVLQVGDFSMELCGGTHVQRAGDIGLFKIVSESGVASGVRRIEALTGEAAVEYVEQNDALLRDLASLMRGSREEIADKMREHAPDGARDPHSQGSARLRTRRGSRGGGRRCPGCQGGRDQGGRGRCRRVAQCRRSVEGPPQIGGSGAGERAGCGQGAAGRGSNTRPDLPDSGG